MSESIENLLNTEIIRPRMAGYTTTIVEAARFHEGTVITGTMQQAQRIQKETGAKARSVQENLRGTKGPYFWDSSAFMTAYNDIQVKVSSKLDLENLNDELVLENKKLRSDHRFLGIAFLAVALCLLAIILYAPVSANAYEVNVYSATEKNTSVLEIVDDCDKSYKLVVENANLGSSKTVEWITKKIEDPDFCLDL